MFSKHINLVSIAGQACISTYEYFRENDTFLKPNPSIASQACISVPNIKRENDFSKSIP
jgi:hypothetical protein